MALNSNFRTLTADNIEGIVDEKNYLRSSFENGTLSGWREMAVTVDANGFPNATPTIGTDASPNAASSLSLSATSTTPLSGARSLLVTVPTSLSQGQGFISEEFTLDRMDLGKVLTVSFDYERISGTYNFSGTRGSQTWMVYIYDATLGAANWIQPAGFLGMNQSSNPGRVACTFQTSVTAGQKYRVAVIAHQAAAGASSIEFDNFTCSRQTAPIGPVVTDWVSYTPTGTWTTNTTYTGRWRRVGANGEYEVGITLSGAPNAATLYVTLPSGQTIDTARLTNISRALPNASGSVNDASPLNNYKITAFYNDASSVLVTIDNASSTYSILNVVNNTVPVTFASGDALTITFSVPITGWSSNVQLSNDTDTRVVAFSAYDGGGVGVTNTTALLPMGTTEVDTHSVRSGNTYVVPVSGFYRLAAKSTTRFSVGNTAFNHSLLFSKNGVLQNNGDYGNADGANSAGVEFFFLSINSIVRLNAGDVIDFRYFTNYTGTATTYLKYCSIERLSGPSVVAASETVAMRAVKNTGAQTASGVTQTVASWTSVVQDTHGIFNATTGVATIPVSGTYLCTFQVQLAANSTGARVTQMYKNGAVGVGSMQAESNIYVSFIDRPVMVGGALLKLNAGDNLRLATYQDGAPSLNYSTFDATSTNFNIVRVGN